GISRSTVAAGRRCSSRVSRTGRRLRPLGNGPHVRKETTTHASHEVEHAEGAGRDPVLRGPRLRPRAAADLRRRLRRRRLCSPRRAPRRPVHGGDVRPAGEPPQPALRAPPPPPPPRPRPPPPPP